MANMFKIIVALALLCLAAASVVNSSLISEQEGRKVVRYFVGPLRTEKQRAVDTTNEIVVNFKSAMNRKQERDIAEHYLLYANLIKNMHDSIPAKSSSLEVDQFKVVLLKIVKFLTRKSDHPGVDILRSQLTQLSKLKGAEQTKATAATKEEEADSEWITAALKIASTVMNVADNIGTYHQKISQVGNFISNQAASTLSKLGLEGAANVARKTGNAITTFSNDKIAPIENKVAAYIAPVVKSAPFQTVKNVLNVVDNVIGGVGSIKSGLNMLGVAKNVKLPQTFSALKNGLKQVTGLAKNGQLGKNVLAVGKTLVSNFKKADKLTKYNSIGKIYNGVSSITEALSGKNIGRVPTFGKGKKQNNNSRSTRNTRNTRNGNSRRNSGPRNNSPSRRGNNSRRNTSPSRNTRNNRNTSRNTSRNNRSTPRNNRNGNNSRRSTSPSRNNSVRRGNNTRRNTSPSRNGNSRRVSNVSRNTSRNTRGNASRSFGSRRSTGVSRNTAARPNRGFSRGGSRGVASRPARSSFSRPSRPSYSRPARPSFSRPSRPSYSRPSRPSFSRPSYSRPSRPSYSRPSYSRPSYSRPSYSRPSYSRPSYSRPSYSRPSYSRPSYSRPSYSRPSFSGGRRR